MKRYVLNLTAILGLLITSLLLAVGLVGADNTMRPKWVDTWIVFCSVKDSVTGKRSCDLSYSTIQPGGRSQAWAAISFMDLDDGRLAALAGPTDNKCPNNSLLLRVDSNSPVKSPKGQADKYFAVGDEAEALVQQFIEGEQATMRVYLPPECIAQDLHISLHGFREAWKRYNANALSE